MWPNHRFNQHDCAATLWEMARMDRLPKENSLEALRTLRSAWDTIDVCLQVSRRNKLVSKGAYLLLLLLGVATTCVATFVATDVIPDDGEGGDSSSLKGSGPVAITVLSLLTSVCIGVISFLAPVQKWQQLRSTASQLESETWRFRTRTGPYSRSANGGRDRGCDRVLVAEMHRIRRSVIESAAIKDTRFFRVRAPHVYRHGQRSDSLFDTTASGGKDNFYSVLRPSDYIELRVRPSIKFYESRLPRYYREALVVSRCLSSPHPLSTPLWTHVCMPLLPPLIQCLMAAPLIPPLIQWLMTLTSNSISDGSHL